MYLGQPWTQRGDEQSYNLMKICAPLFFSNTVELITFLLFLFVLLLLLFQMLSGVPLYKFSHQEYFC